MRQEAKLIDLIQQMDEENRSLKKEIRMLKELLWFEENMRIL